MGLTWVNQMEQQYHQSGIMPNHHDMLSVTAMRLDGCHDGGSTGLVDAVRPDDWQVGPVRLRQLLGLARACGSRYDHQFWQ